MLPTRGPKSFRCKFEQLGIEGASWAIWHTNVCFQAGSSRDQLAFESTAYFGDLTFNVLETLACTRGTGIRLSVHELGLETTALGCSR
jgi:hypothetical protein